MRHEIEDILFNLYLSSKYKPEISVANSVLCVSSVGLFAAIEILTRSLCIQDLRLQILDKKCHYKKTFKKICEGFDWKSWLPAQARVRITARSIASHLYHEGMLKEILTSALQAEGFEVATAEDESQALSTLFVEFNHDRLHLSLSLAGSELFKRGFRQLGQSVAPLREDLAQACIMRALTYCQSLNSNYDPQTLLVPFGGSGTFIFEYLLNTKQIAPCLLGRPLALQELPIFNAKNFAFITKQAAQRSQRCSLKKIAYLDLSEKALSSFQNNLTSFQKHLEPLASKARDEISNIEIDAFQGNFFTEALPATSGDVFVPLNPPYGLRLQSSARPESIYAKIGKQLLELRKQMDTKDRLGGFILCPSETTWSAFVRKIGATNTQTYHVSQGGQDIRVCQFVLGLESYATADT